MPSERKRTAVLVAPGWSASRILLLPDATCVLFSAPCVVSTSQISCPLFDGSHPAKYVYSTAWIVRPSACRL